MKGISEAVSNWGGEGNEMLLTRNNEYDQVMAKRVQTGDSPDARG